MGGTIEEEEFEEIDLLLIFLRQKQSNMFVSKKRKSKGVVKLLPWPAGGFRALDEREGEREKKKWFHIITTESVLLVSKAVGRILFHASIRKVSQQLRL